MGAGSADNLSELGISGDRGAGIRLDPETVWGRECSPDTPPLLEVPENSRRSSVSEGPKDLKMGRLSFKTSTAPQLIVESMANETVSLLCVAPPMRELSRRGLLKHMKNGVDSGECVMPRTPLFLFAGEIVRRYFGRERKF
ncbi:MAG: hypothetical protein E7029_05880 [Planctomycetaceae bacterium]|nr:hypothetical protein [Planctomycetaceae bacterium]